MDKQEPVAKFKVGDPVQRAEPRSYLFPGIVIGANLKLDGKTWLYSVECIAPGVEGMVHEFTERALEARANRPADDGLVARLEKLAAEAKDEEGLERVVTLASLGDLVRDNLPAILSALREREAVVETVETVCAAFEKDIAQGYKSSTRDYVLDMFRPHREHMKGEGE